jgi:capsular polysaccharide transport system permease protein
MKRPKENSEAPRRPGASALAINLSVIAAVLLRDIRVRAGPYYTGFLMLLLMPLVHLVAILVIYHLFSRLAPVGTDQIVYFGLSVLPFVIFVYPARQIVIAILENRPLLYFSRVKLIDIILSRFILEAACSVVVFIFVFMILFFFSDRFSPRDWTGIVSAVAATIYLALCVGSLNALLSYAIPAWFLFFNVSMPILWAASGIIFFPLALPEPYGQWLALNPLLQCIEWIRYSYYEDYSDRLINIPYLFCVATAQLAIALVLEKIGRRRLRSG